MTTDPHDSDPAPSPTESPDSGTETPVSEMTPASSQPVSPSSAAATSAPSAGSSGGSLGYPEMGSGAMQPKEEKTWSMLSHLLQISGIFTAGIGYFVGPLIVYLLKKQESPFVEEHAKESLNFGILSFLIVFISGMISLTGFIGFVVGCIVGLVSVAMVIINLILVIQATMRANDGQPYRYSINWRLIR